jgi:hypothetical protein
LASPLRHNQPKPIEQLGNFLNLPRGTRSSKRHAAPEGGSLKKERSDRENKKDRIHCCEIRRKLAEQFATAARLYDEAVAAFSSTPFTVSQGEYNRLRKVAEEAQGRAEAIGGAFEEHVESHRCQGEAFPFTARNDQGARSLRLWRNMARHGTEQG